MTKRWFASIVLTIVALTGCLIPDTSHSDSSTAKILVLYKERDPDHAGLINIFSGILSEAGYTYDKYDVEKLLDDNVDMSPYAGVMTLFQTSQMVHADLYPYWLVQQMEAGRPILIIGSYGAYQGRIPKPDGTYVEWNESTEAINTFFHPFGLEFHFAFTGDNKKLRIVTADKEYAQYEQRLRQSDLHYYQLYKSVNPANRVFLELERTDMPYSRSALNVVTPFGGMIIEGYSFFWDAAKNKNVFRVNFPKLMQEVFSAKPPPVSTQRIRTHAELMKEYPLPERAAPEPREGLKAGELPRRVLVLGVGA